MDFQIPSGRFLCKQIFYFKMYGSDKCSLKNYAWMVEGYLLCWVCFSTHNSNTHTHTPWTGSTCCNAHYGRRELYVQEREHKSHHVLYVPQMGANLRCDVSLCLQVFLRGTGWGALGLTWETFERGPSGMSYKSGHFTARATEGSRWYWTMTQWGTVTLPWKG